MYVIISFIINALAVLVSAYIVPGVVVSSFTSALGVSVVLGLLNALVRPVLLLLTLPINILTLGLFTIVINIGLLYLTAAIVPRFQLDGLLSTLLFALVLSLVSSVLGVMVLNQ